MAVGRMNFPKRRRYNFHLRMLCDNFINHAEEGTRVKFRSCGNLGAWNSQPLLQVLLVSYKNIGILNDPRDHLDCFFLTSPNIPKLLTEIQIETDNRPRLLRRLHPFNN